MSDDADLAAARHRPPEQAGAPRRSAEPALTQRWQCWGPTARLAVLGVAVAATWWWAGRDRLPADFRFGVVDSGRFYRSGQLDRRELEQVIRRHGIRTVVNLRAEEPDPQLDHGWSESTLCERLGVEYVALRVGCIHKLVPDSADDSSTTSSGQLTPVVARFINILDNPANAPVLVHCAGGLYRTGVLVALYRREYQHWPPADALAELAQFGYDVKRHPDDQRVFDFVRGYQPRSAATLARLRSH